MMYLTTHVYNYIYNSLPQNHFRCKRCCLHVKAQPKGCKVQVAPSSKNAGNKIWEHHLSCEELEEH